MSKYYFDHSGRKELLDSCFVQLFEYYGGGLYESVYEKALHSCRRQLRYGGNPDILEERRLRLRHNFKLRASHGKLEVYKIIGINKGGWIEEVY